MKTILLTGASGFIGSHIAKKLLSENHKVIAPVRLHSQDKLNKLTKFENFKILSGDFYDANFLKQISEKIDVVLHFASIRGEGGGDEKEYKKINIEGTRNLLEFARISQIPKFIYCSSVGVLGTIPQNQPTSVNQQVNPDNLYHNSKWESERLVNEYNSSLLNTCVLRPTITYGPGDDGFIPRLVDMVKSKKFPLTSKDVFIHLLDVAAFSKLVSSLVESGEIKGKTYIVADKSPVLLKDLVTQVSEIIGNGSGFIKVPAIIFNLGELGLKLLNQKKLLTSIQLINKSWTYQIDETVNDLGFQASETLTVLSSHLKEIKSN